ncbi:hypothetical protein CAEBREN_23961 [Caenorhabditis brenneri]|uniref:Uncharacterized protein n=1 Tax=Caenorhabditis brenneri TaxID=135651 RepID=G0N1D0_CAEBE|nr:hypothetical protein CAEBREN_23961 [Caenorhabditis brenneri]
MEKETGSKKESAAVENNDVESKVMGATPQPIKELNEELVKVVRKTCKEPEGQLRGSIKAIHFLLNLSSTMFFIPSGLDIFSTFVLTLLKDNNPFNADRTLVSIAIDIGDSATSMGTQFKTIGEVSASDIHRRIEEAEILLRINRCETTPCFHESTTIILCVIVEIEDNVLINTKREKIISAPANTTHGLSANVMIRNGLRGVNDYIKVVDMKGSSYVMNNRTELNETYIVIPGAEMTIQVVTRSVYMQSMFEITVEYLSAQIGPTFPMKTDGEMNYIDVSSLRNGKSLYNSVTFVGTEPIHVTNAVPSQRPHDCWDCFVIDGTIENQTQIHRVIDFDWQPFTTKSNAITIVSSSDHFLGYVFNPKSEADKVKIILFKIESCYLQLFIIISLAVDGSVEENGASMGSFRGRPGAVQVVNFETNGIVMDRFDTDGVSFQFF